MRVLVTGFDPFGGETVNPALEAVKLLPEQIGSMEIYKLEVPTVFGKAIEVVREEILRLQPDAVICVGQAGGRCDISVERIAVNCMDAGIADNAGCQPADEPIEPDGCAAYFSTLPIKKMVEAIREAGIPASVSDSAGTFVCNHLMYGVLAEIERAGMDTIAGFIHVPFIPAQVAKEKLHAASMALLDITAGLTAGIAVLEERFSCQDAGSDAR